MIPISAYNPYFFFVESYSTIKMCVFAKNFLKIDGAIAILSFMEKFLNFFSYIVTNFLSLRIIDK